MSLLAKVPTSIHQVFIVQMLPGLFKSRWLQTETSSAPNPCISFIKLQLQCGHFQLFVSSLTDCFETVLCNSHKGYMAHRTCTIHCLPSTEKNELATVLDTAREEKPLVASFLGKHRSDREVSQRQQEEAAEQYDP